MANFQAPKWPDNYQNHIDRPAIIRTAENLWVWPQMWKVVYDTKNWVATIFVKWEAKKEASELSEDFRKAFIQKLKQLPDYNWSKVQEAIEKWTIEIRKIPNRNWYAIYESKTWNLVYLTRIDWSQYENVDKFRNKDLFWAMIIWWFVRQWLKIELDKQTWLWRLYKKDWEEVPIFSDEYSVFTLNSLNFMRSELRWWEEKSKEKKED